MGGKSKQGQALKIEVTTPGSQLTKGLPSSKSRTLQSSRNTINASVRQVKLPKIGVDVLDNSHEHQLHLKCQSQLGIKVSEPSEMINFKSRRVTIDSKVTEKIATPASLEASTYREKEQIDEVVKRHRAQKFAKNFDGRLSDAGQAKHFISVSATKTLSESKSAASIFKRDSIGKKVQISDKKLQKYKVGQIAEELHFDK